MLLRLWLVLVAMVGTAAAQVSGGAISGTVTDPSGAVIAGADIAIESVNTGEIRRIATTTTGLYSAPNLAPGLYRVTVTAPGFSALVRSNLQVQVASELVVNLQMQLGAATQKVEVVEESPAVDAATSSIGAVNNGQTVRELPLNGRDWTSLASLQPGVAVVRTQQAPALSVVRANRGLGTFMTVSGNRPQQNNYRLDGISVNDYSGSGPASVLGVSLGVDAIQEFSVVTGNASADYGKSSGGVINAVTRAGTNSFHGSAYEFLRNSALDARNFFDRATLPQFKRNQFGGSVGGPVRHDKTFFFVDYEGLRQGLGVTDVDTVPTALARAGHLTSGTVAVDPKVAPYLNLYPLPNGVIKGDIGTYTFATQNTTNEDFFTTRVDHHFSDSDTVHGTFLFDNGDTQGPDAFNDVLLGTLSRRKTANLEESHIFSPAVINFARIGFNRMIAEQVKTLSALNPEAGDTTLGFVPGQPIGQINVASLTNFQGGLGATGEYRFHYNSYQVYDDLAVTRGGHSLKTGISFERVQSNGVGGGSPNGMVVFGSLSGFLTNQPTTFTANLPGSGNPIGLRQSVFGAYVQDDWRIRPNLTLNLGFRYEMATVPSEQYGRIGTLTALDSPQLKIGSPLFQNPTLRDFSPRVGFSWDPFRNGKTAVRGGFGVYDSLPLTYQFSLLSVLSAPSAAQGTTASLPHGAFPDGLYNAISPTALRTAYIEQDPKRNYVIQWNLNVQREVAPNLVAELGYAGSHGAHSPFVSSDVNTVQPVAALEGYLWPTPRGSGIRINPTTGAITCLVWQVSSTYDALRARILKRLSHGLQVQGSYTWSKSLDTGSNSFQTAFSNSVSSLPLFDSHIRKSLSDFDVRQNFVLNGIWEIPGRKATSPAMAWLANGWQFGTILSASSGLPFTPVIAGDPLGLNSGTPYAFPDRLNLPGCGNPINADNPNAYIKTECFAAPNPGTRLGNAGRNVAIGPGLLSLDTSLFKNNPIRRISENFNLQFRAELFNVINHANFSPPTSTSLQVFAQTLAPLTSAGILTATSTTSRQIQFALKMIW
jgi:hypothetical protein